jgi:hypothetical protein
MATAQEVENYAARMKKVGPVNVEEILAPKNRQSTYPMTPFERKQVEEGKLRPVYIYNVSPCHEWFVNQGQLGTKHIEKRELSKLVSNPLVIDGVIARQYDKGLGKKGWHLEDGIDIAEDICQSSNKYPAGDRNSNLTNWGVFILNNEEFDGRSHKHLVQQATDKLIATCQVFIQQASQYHEGIPAPIYKGLIGPGHKNCLIAYNAITGSKLEYPWASSAVSITSQEDCRFCGGTNKLGVAVCFHCKNVLDKAKYEALLKGA